MKLISLSLVIILASFQLALGQQSTYPVLVKKLPKKVRPYLKGMVYLKGGSWASTLIYLQPYTKEVCAPEQTRSTIGFRIAM